MVIRHGALGARTEIDEKSAARRRSPNDFLIGVEIFKLLI
jgi:hypothetical protein